MAQRGIDRDEWISTRLADGVERGQTLIPLWPASIRDVSALGTVMLYSGAMGSLACMNRQAKAGVRTTARMTGAFSSRRLRH